MAGSTLWNSKDSTGGEDEQGHTRVHGVPDWRCLDLLRRPKVKWLSEVANSLVSKGDGITP